MYAKDIRSPAIESTFCLVDSHRYVLRIVLAILFRLYSLTGRKYLVLNLSLFFFTVVLFNYCLLSLDFLPTPLTLYYFLHPPYRSLHLNLLLHTPNFNSRNSLLLPALQESIFLSSAEIHSIFQPLLYFSLPCLFSPTLHSRSTSSCLHPFTTHRTGILSSRSHLTLQPLYSLSSLLSSPTLISPLSFLPPTSPPPALSASPSSASSIHLSSIPSSSSSYPSSCSPLISLSSRLRLSPPPPYSSSLLLH